MLCLYVHIIDKKTSAWRGFVRSSRSHRQLVVKVEFYPSSYSRKQTINPLSVLERKKKSCILKGNGRKCIDVK